MNDMDTTQALSLEDRLKAILYQFLKLYERWSEDRQVSMKELADLNELVGDFSQEVTQFKKLEPKVRQHLAASIHQATSDAVEAMSEKMRKDCDPSDRSCCSATCLSGSQNRRDSLSL
jgi:hypothetical protein